MFYVRTAFENIRCYKFKSLLNGLICIVVVLFLNLYMGSLEKSRLQLESLPDKIPVEATIVNLSGGRESGLFIKEAFYEGVMESKEVSEPKFNLSLIGYRGQDECAVLAANTWKAISGVQKDMLSFFEGDADTFFSSNAKECLVTADFMEGYNLKAGDEISIDLQYYVLDTKSHVEISAHPLETVSYRIVGSVDEELSTDTEDVLLPEIIIPMETARDSYHNQNVKFFVDSGVFNVKDPLNLNTFKQSMKKIGFMEIVPQADNALEGFALVVRDETFVRASGSMREGYQIMRNFLPLIGIVLASAGFITSYLLTNGRRREYALMRSLGTTKRACLSVFLLEHGMVDVLGGAAGTLAAACVMRMNVKWLVIDFFAFLLCFLAGSLMAILMLGRISVMEILTKAD